MMISVSNTVLCLRIRSAAGYLAVLFSLTLGCLAQTPSPDAASPVTPKATPSPGPQPTPIPKPPPSLEKRFIKNILRDQKAIWTSPFGLRGEDAKWLVPFGVGVAGLMATDRRTSALVGRGGSLPGASRTVSLAGSGYAAGGVAGAFYLVGRFTNNRKARETGLLAAEALINSGVVTHALKLATQRTRPNDDAGSGEFFERGNSFPSGHASSVWSVATVIAYEYENRPVVRYGAFAAATAVSLSRYSGRKHFLSDVLVGSAIGFGIGRFVYRSRHETNKPSAADQVPPKTSTRLIPMIAPIYDGRSSTYGGVLTWNF